MALLDAAQLRAQGRGAQVERRTLAGKLLELDEGAIKCRAECAVLCLRLLSARLGDCGALDGDCALLRGRTRVPLGARRL